jgi:8-oxo-dGTP diphosphatase
MDTSEVILAAGGVIHRINDENEYEVLLVHRPRYDDWSWPKGKCKSGESLVDCAIREVEEETGILTEVGPVLCVLTYLDQFNRTKTVTHFALSTVTIGEHEPDDEIDKLAWVRLQDVDQWLTVDDDVQVTTALITHLKGHSLGDSLDT